jgi:sarcosine oxidase subunit alpha
MTVNRLQEPFGLVLDRAQSKAFQFDGSNYVGHSGDTLASALAANNVWCLSESAKGGRPHGLFSQASVSRPCLVDVQENLAVNPEDQILFDGMCVTGLWEKPSRRNWLKRAQKVFSGMTVQSRQQSEAPKIWATERRFGFSSLTNHLTDERPAPRRRHITEVAIVGGGPSGVAAAIEAARLGKKVTLIERLPLLGGSLNFMRLDVDSEVGEVLRRAACRGVVGGRRKPDDSALRHMQGDNARPATKNRFGPKPITPKRGTGHSCHGCFGENFDFSQ